MRKLSGYVIMKILLVVLLAVGMALAPHETAAHTFHTSLMQMEYNLREQTVEVAVQVFTHDLENVLTRRNGKRVNLERTPNASQLMLAYLREAFVLKNSRNETKIFSWVGMERSGADAVWLYVEAKMPEGLAGAQVRNRIFFELLEDQVNLVHVKFEGKKTDLVFKPGDDFKAITRSDN